jgi:preprotein translocase subunit YajC
MTHSAHFVALVLAAASTSKKTSSSSLLFPLFLIVIVFAGYFFFVRPQQQKARAQRSKQSEVEVGDEILTVGGIVGTVTDMTDDRITIVSGDPSNGIAPTHMVLVRQAIARKIEPPVVDDEPEEDYDDHGGDAHDHDEHGEGSEP